MGGYRTLTEFIIHSAQEKARIIIQEHQQIFKTNLDREIFFSEMLNPGKPNQELQLAAEKYTEYLRKNDLPDSNS